jgi:2,4-didehydro-3-deoxy-L-rhamnonate hydrolase
MIYVVARLTGYPSEHVELWPGDLICTGSPAGNGAYYNRFLRPGDVMEAEIDGLGTQRNVCNLEAKLEG